MIFDGWANTAAFPITQGACAHPYTLSRLLQVKFQFNPPLAQVFADCGELRPIRSLRLCNNQTGLLRKIHDFAKLRPFLVRGHTEVRLPSAQPVKLNSGFGRNGLKAQTGLFSPDNERISWCLYDERKRFVMVQMEDFL